MNLNVHSQKINRIFVKRKYKDNKNESVSPVSIQTNWKITFAGIVRFRFFLHFLVLLPHSLPQKSDSGKYEEFLPKAQ